MASVRRILAVKPSSLGDILHTFPALSLLRRAYPGAELDFMVGDSFAEILDYSPFPVSRRIIFRRRKMGSPAYMLPEFLAMFFNLRRQRYDAVIDFQGLLRSAFFARCAKSAGVCGFAETREKSAGRFYRRRYGVSAGHAVERNLELAEQITGLKRSAEDFSVPPAISGYAAAAAALWPSEHGIKRVALLPGARWPSKQFPPRLFAAVADGLNSRSGGKTEFAVLGGAGDAGIAAEIAELASGCRIMRLAGKSSLGVMMELLRSADAVVSNDSGPVHAAALLGKPVFAFYGPTPPERTGPYGAGARIYRAGLPCLGCMRRVCPENSGCHGLNSERIIEDIIHTWEAL